ncbi:helix-turn-helix transcriptional regulator [Maricaulis sp.]|uniref:helix-turn-helix transcriptional regulator n=1 Tax=Maricaulis sp. TaxID=1486257 RepID=UPI0032982FD3
MIHPPGSRQPIVNTLVGCSLFPGPGITFRIPNPEAASIPRNGLSNLLFVKRKTLQLSKKAVAGKLGVHVEVVGQWERGEHLPRVKYVPALVDFLGDDRWLPSDTFSDRLYRFRAMRGWSQEKLGTWLGVDGRTVGRWEDGAPLPEKRRRDFDRRMMEASDQERRSRIEKNVTPRAAASNSASE